MSWISGNCQGDRNFECYYAGWNNFDEQWCVDSDEACWNVNDGGALVRVVDHRAPAGGGW